MHHCVYAAGPTNELLKRACFKAYVCSNKVNQINILSVTRLFRETRERHWCFNAVVPIRSPCTSAEFDAKHVFFYSGPKQKSSTYWVSLGCSVKRVSAIGVSMRWCRLDRHEQVPSSMPIMFSIILCRFLATSAQGKKTPHIECHAAVP